MTLEQQLCSLELAKQLKELGVKQESLFYFSRVNLGGQYELDFGVRGPWEAVDTEHAISAFTVAELGEMLPWYYFTRYHYDMEEKRHWSVYSPYEEDYIDAELMKYQGQEADTEADARAKMLVYLLENKLITV